MKKKLKLDDLKIQSFVTNLDEQQSMHAIGGAIALTNGGICNTLAQSCITGCQSCPECPQY